VRSQEGHYQRQLLAAARLARANPELDAIALSELLYEEWYAPACAPPIPSPSPSQMVAHFRSVDVASRRFESGWVATQPDRVAAQIGPAESSWQIPAARGAEARWVNPIDLVYPGHVGLRPPAGASIEVSERRDSTRLLPGWWTRFTPQWLIAQPPLIRLYWAVEPQGPMRLVRELTACLDPSLPYALKCALDLSRYLRPDGVVIYLPASEWPAARNSVMLVHRRVEQSLRADIPALTLEIGRGLALAEDPGNTSFGMHRCRLVANALRRRSIYANDDAAIDAITSEFRRHGVDIEAPYRVTGSGGDYGW
jgi:hypothetical protein